MADASLTSVPPNLRAEIVTPVLRYEDMAELQEVIRAVRRAGAKVDNRCGIHIHIGAEPFDGRALGNLAKIIYKQEALILHALEVSQERLARYTLPIARSSSAASNASSPVPRMNSTRSGTAIEESDAAFHGRANQRDPILLVKGMAIAKAHAHAAEPEGRNFQVALAKFTLLQCFYHLSVARVLAFGGGQRRCRTGHRVTIFIINSLRRKEQGLRGITKGMGIGHAGEGDLPPEVGSFRPSRHGFHRAEAKTPP